MIGWTKRDWKLYLYAFPRTLSVLVNFAAKHGRGWYQYADGEVITASEVEL